MLCFGAHLVQKVDNLQKCNAKMYYLVFIKALIKLCFSETLNVTFF